MKFERLRDFIPKCSVPNFFQPIFPHYRINAPWIILFLNIVLKNEQLLNNIEVFKQQLDLKINSSSTVIDFTTRCCYRATNECYWHSFIGS